MPTASLPLLMAQLGADSVGYMVMPVFSQGKMAGQPLLDAQRFDAGMASRHAESNAALATGFDFSGIGTLVDVGGGNGSLLATVLGAHPTMQGVAERCRIVGGDFFEAVPPGGDAYLLSSVLHDWEDARATAILRSIH